jgi:hypothetical protein
VTRPDSATALGHALRSCIPEDKAYCLDVIVLDVTPPAARLIQTGYIRMVDATIIGSPLEEFQYYQLGQGESEALTLTARLGVGTVMVTDDFLALIIAHRLGTSCQLFLDFVIGRAARGELPLVEAQQVVQAVSSRYPVGFVPHSLAMLRRLQP